MGRFINGSSSPLSTRIFTYWFVSITTYINDTIAQGYDTTICAIATISCTTSNNNSAKNRRCTWE